MRLAISFVLFAAMSRIAGVAGPATIVVDNREVQLTGVEIVDPAGATAFLSWSVGSWVLVENGLVYRSPDGVLLNSELVARGFARSTAPATVPQSTLIVTYLGEAPPEGGRPRPQVAPAGKKSAPARAPARHPARRIKVRSAAPGR